MHISLFSLFFLSLLNSFNSCAPVVFHWWRERRGCGVLNSDARLVYSTNRRSIGLVGGFFSFRSSVLFFPLVIIVFLIFMGSGRSFLLLFYLFYKYHNYYYCGLALCWGLYIFVLFCNLSFVSKGTCLFIYF